MTKTSKENCGTCFYAGPEYKVFGMIRVACLRYPPSVVVKNADEMDTEWPEMHPLEWCGEFKNIKRDGEKI